MDGTLVDSEDYHWRSWREAMAPEGVPITHSHFLATFGQRNDEILPAWLGADATPERIERLAGAKEAHYREMIGREGIVALPGAAQWVARLKAAGWLQAIASSAPRLNVEAILRALRFNGEVQAVTSAEDVHRGKPDPEVFLVAAAKLGVEPARCVVVEDALVGIEAARRAGMRSIGVSRKVKLPADVYVQSLDELPADTFERLVCQP